MQLFVIHYHLQLLQYSNFEWLMFRIMLSSAFFGLLRSSKYTSAGRLLFAATNTLLCLDISFAADDSIMYIFIRASKTDPFRSSCTILIADVQATVCPVRLMRQYL